MTLATAALCAAALVPAGPAAADVRPATPTGVVASAGDGSATVRWKDLINKTGGLTQYTITASPGGAEATTTTTTGTVTGLSNGTEYTFRVVARSGAAASDPSAPSNPVVPVAAGG